MVLVTGIVVIFGLKDLHLAKVLRLQKFHQLLCGNKVKAKGAFGHKLEHFARFRDLRSTYKNS